MLVGSADVRVSRVLDVVDVLNVVDVGRLLDSVGIRSLSVRDSMPVEFTDSTVAEPFDAGRSIRAIGITWPVVAFAGTLTCNLVVDIGRSTGVFGRSSPSARGCVAVVRLTDILVSRVVGGAERFVAAVCRTAAGTRGLARPKIKRRWHQVSCISVFCSMVVLLGWIDVLGE